MKAVHGGAIATILDASVALNMFRNQLMAVTIDMKVSYKMFLPLQTICMLVSEVKLNVTNNAFN